MDDDDDDAFVVSKEAVILTQEYSRVRRVCFSADNYALKLNACQGANKIEHVLFSITMRPH